MLITSVKTYIKPKESMFLFVGEDVHILKSSRFRVTGQEGEVAEQKESFPLMGRNAIA